MNVKTLVELALKEDSAKHDITTAALIPKNKIISAKLVAEEAGVICGLDVARLVFLSLDKKVKFIKKVQDGCMVAKGRALATITGNARAILSAERTALNFLQHLSGIATLTRKYVVMAGKSSKIYDTRKTTPLLRKLEKHAVRSGGGHNHRVSLEDMVLIKDNHLRAIKNVELKIKNVAGKKIEIETDNMKQVKEFVKLNPDIIMLDNMNIENMRKAIRYIRLHCDSEIEVSGNVNLKTVRKIASLKPDRISVGEITHSAPALDISLEF